MKKIEMERSTFRLISELKRIVLLLDNNTGSDYDEVVWGSLKNIIKDLKDQKWIFKEMETIDKFLEREDVKKMGSGAIDLV